MPLLYPLYCLEFKINEILVACFKLGCWSVIFCSTKWTIDWMWPLTRWKNNGAAVYSLLVVKVSIFIFYKREPRTYDKLESVPHIPGQLKPKFRLLTFQHASTFSHKEIEKCAAKTTTLEIHCLKDLWNFTQTLTKFFFLIITQVTLLSIIHSYRIKFENKKKRLKHIWCLLCS